MRLFTLEVTNPGDAAETYSLEVGGVDGAAVDLADTATVGPGETVALTLAIATDPSLSNVSQDFVVTATGTLGGQDKVVGMVEIGANLLRPATTGGVVLGLTEHDLQVGAAGTAQTEVVVTNTGSREMLYNLSVTLPPGFGGGLLRRRLRFPGRFSAHDSDADRAGRVRRLGSADGSGQSRRAIRSRRMMWSLR